MCNSFCDNDLEESGLFCRLGKSTAWHRMADGVGFTPVPGAPALVRGVTLKQAQKSEVNVKSQESH